MRVAVAMLLVGATLLGGATTSALVAAERTKPTVPVERVAFSLSYPTQATVRVKARWAPACDSLGCADRYMTAWSGAGATRTTSSSQLIDSVTVMLPAPGDSTKLTIAVTPVRRGLQGPMRTASLWLRMPDRAPPGVDSLRVDTLALQQVAEAAFRDSFPEANMTIKFSHGRTGFALHEQRQTCVLQRNRYTGEVILGVPLQLLQDSIAHDAYVSACEPLRLAQTTARDG